MKKNPLLLLLLFCLFSTTDLSAGTEALYRQVLRLHNGRVVKGNLLNRPTDSLLRMETVDGSLLLIPHRDVESQELEEVLPVKSEAIADSGIVLKKKSVLAAMALSYFLPGGGQYYNGQYPKGVLMTLTGVGGLAAVIIGMSQNNETVSDIGGVMMMASWWVSFIDAGVSAGKLNRMYKASLREMNLGNGYRLKVEPLLSPGILPSGSGLTRQGLVAGLSLKLTL